MVWRMKLRSKASRTTVEKWHPTLKWMQTYLAPFAPKPAALQFKSLSRENIIFRYRLWGFQQQSKLYNVKSQVLTCVYNMEINPFFLKRSLITFNHLRCHSSSTALGIRTGYWKPTDPLLISTDFLKYPFWHLFQTGIKFQ